MNDKTDMRIFAADKYGKETFNLNLLKKGIFIHAKDHGKNYPLMKMLKF